MEWFFQWIDQLTSSGFWQTYVVNFQWVDWFAFLFLFFGVLYGVKNGVFGEIAEIAEFVVIIFLTYEIYPRVTTFVANEISHLPEASVMATSFISTALVVWFCVSFVARFLKKFFHADAAFLFRVVGGALLGAIHLTLIFSFISQAILLLPLKKLKDHYKKGYSYSGYYIAKIVPSVYKVIREPMTLFEEDKPKQG